MTTPIHVRLITPEQIAARERLERVCIYGASKTGKSRLVGALPRKSRKWGKIAYIAVDENSDLLATMIDTSDIYVINPIPESGLYDPLEEYTRLFTLDYSQIDPEIHTIVVDTASVMTRSIMEAYVDTGAVQKNHVSLGRKGTASFHGAPDKSDFGAAQRSHNHLRKMLFKQPHHVIMLYHEDWVEAKSGGLDELTGGPATVGIASIREIPKDYDTVLRTTSLGGRFAIQTQRIGPWPAEIRHARVGVRLGTNGYLVMQDNPAHCWVEYDNFVAGSPMPAAPAANMAAPSQAPAWS